MHDFNGDFEQGWDGHDVEAYPVEGGSYKFEKGNVFNPKGWMTYFRVGGGYGEPEVGLMHGEYYPERVVDGVGTSVKLFTSSRIHDGGMRTQVEVGAGNIVNLAAQAHAWSNHRGDDYFLCWQCFYGVEISPEEGWAPCPNCGTGINREVELVFPNPHDGRWSEGVGYEEAAFYTEPETNGTPRQDAKSNISVMIGIDPTGGTNPYSDSVVWGDAAWIYNAFAEVPEIEVEAESDVVTLFLRSTVKFPFIHCDVYWDDVRLTVEGGDDDDDNGEEEKPRIEFPYPVIDKGIKLGVHSIWSNRVNDFADQLGAGGTHFPVVKAVDDIGWLMTLAANHPETITVGRFVSEWEGAQGVADATDAEIQQMAAQLFNVILDRATGDQLETIDYWEICNEPDPGTPEGYARLADLMIECMDLAEEFGLKLALFAFNAGTPEWDESVAMAETGVFARAKEGGHIVAVHEASFSGENDPKRWWPGSIPGAPEVEGAGPLNFRYRYLGHLMEERNEVVPIFASEWRCEPEHEAEVETIVDALMWYTGEASKDYYYWAVCPFTLGPVGIWKELCDYEPFYPPMVENMIAYKDEPNALPPEGEPEPEPDPEEPYVDYEVTVRVPLPTPESHDRAIEDARANWNTVVPSLHDARRLTSVRCPSGKTGLAIIYDIDTEERRDEIREFFAEMEPTARLKFVGGNGSPLGEYVVGDLPTNPDSPDYPYETRDVYEEVTHVFVHHTAGAESNHFATIKAIADYHTGPHKDYPGIAYTVMIGNKGDSWQVNDLKTVSFAQGNRHRPGDENRYGIAVCLMGSFIDGNEPSPEAMHKLEQVIEYLDSVTKADLEVWGHKDVAPTQCPGDSWPWKEGWGPEDDDDDDSDPDPDPRDGDLLVGLHDPSGLDYMNEHGMGGVGLTLHQVQTTPMQLDYTRLSDDITVLCRLNWGWADGTGTLPPVEHKDAFVDAVVETMLNARGVDSFRVGNEVNNKREWVGYGTNHVFPLTPEYVVGVYNDIWDRVGDQVSLGPPTVDPYFGPGSDCSVWWQHILAHINGADAIYLHAKTQTNDPAEVRSTKKFGDDPLRWQFFHLLGYKTLLDMVPSRFADLPVYVTEVNPQRRSDGQLGWDDGNTEWVEESIGLFNEDPRVTGIVFYRHPNADEWGLQDKPAILNKIREFAL